MEDLKDKSWEEVAAEAKARGIPAWRKVPSSRATVKVKKVRLIELIREHDAKKGQA